MPLDELDEFLTVQPSKRPTVELDAFLMVPSDAILPIVELDEFLIVPSD